jgi:hypothetical protein
MSINLVIAVTDGGRFDMLRGQPNLARSTSGRHRPRISARFNRASFFCSNCTHRATLSSVAAFSLTPLHCRVR